MKVLLIKDVYKLGRAGDIKKVADGFGRNYIIPQGLGVLATDGAIKQADRIRKQADERRAIVNEEMSGIAALLTDLTLTFAAKAGETGKLYGSVTPQMVVDGIKEKLDVEISRRQIDSEPIRTLGTHKASVRLTVDLIPKVTVIVHREGETAESVIKAEQEAEAMEAEALAAAEDAPEASVAVEAAVEDRVEADEPEETTVEEAPEESTVEITEETAEDISEDKTEE